LHAQGHGNACLRALHPSRNDGQGMADGEGSERVWSRAGRYHIIVKEMGPVKRLEMLEDVMRDIRLGKRESIPHTLKKRYTQVIDIIETLQGRFKSLLIDDTSAKKLWIEERDSFDRSNRPNDQNTEPGMRSCIQKLITEISFHQRDIKSRSTSGNIKLVILH